MQLTDQHIGTEVTVVRDRWPTVSKGTYEGVQPSEWDGAPYHMFRGGHINGTDQGYGRHGFPADEPHRVV